MIKKIYNKYGKSEFVKNVSKLMTGTVIAQAIPILISPILSRFYSPEDFGVYALYVSLVTVIAVLATGQYELAVMLPKKHGDAFHVLVLSCILSVLVGIITFIFVLFFGNYLAELLNNENLKRWLYAVPPAVTIVGLYRALNYWFNRKKLYGAIAKTNVARGITVGTVNLSWIALSKGPAGLVYGHLLGWLMMVVLFLRRLIKYDKRLFPHFRISVMYAKAKRYKRFPLYSSWSALFNNVSVQVPIFLLSVFFVDTVVGYYSFSQRLLSIPMTILGLAVGQVFFRNAAEQKDNPLVLKKITYELYKKLLLIGMLPMLLLMVYADYIFPFVFGAEWYMAGRYAQYLSLAILFVFLASPLTMLFNVLERQNEALYFYIVLFAFRVLALLAGGLYFEDDQTAVLLFGITGVLLWGGLSFYLLNMVKVNIFKALFFTFSRLIILFLLLLLIRYLTDYF